MLSVDLEQSKNRVRIKGAWRIWNEHSGGQTFRQGAAVAPAESTNPDHVFEIHPVTEFGDQDVTAGWTPIDGYDAKQPEDAFNRYENTPARIKPGAGATTITSGGLGYNYVEFQMELSERPFPVVDGSFAYAKVRDLAGELIHRRKPMVFVKGTPPEIAVRALKAGDCLSLAWTSR